MNFGECHEFVKALKLNTQQHISHSCRVHICPIKQNSRVCRDPILISGFGLLEFAVRQMAARSCIYRVAQKNGASVFHCQYFENSMTELRESW